jgi:hypothetical protein
MWAGEYLQSPATSELAGTMTNVGEDLGVGGWDKCIFKEEIA